MAGIAVFAAAALAATVSTIAPATATLAAQTRGAVEVGTDSPPPATTDFVTLERRADGTLRARTISVGDDLTGLSQLMSSETIVVEPEITLSIFSDDPFRLNQWALDRTTFETASASVGGASATVAIIDTGIRGSHEDLSGILVPGADFLTGSGDGLVPDNFHGSHVAGIVAAVAHNNRGITGAGESLRILPVRVLNSAGSGSSADVANGIIWAADQGADVINLSLGSTTNSLVVEAAIDYAVTSGTVVVAAAGNSGNAGNPTMYPAALDNVISVAALDTDDSPAEFSAYGPWIDITAPGVGILSLNNQDDNSYAYANGTSMAAPYVAAAAGLLKAADPSLTVTEVHDLLTATAEDLGQAGKDDNYGWGLVDPAAALAARGTNINPVSTTAGYSFVTSSGKVLNQGLAAHYGSLSDIVLAEPVVGAISTPTGNGYWLVAADGGIFSYGDAAFQGSTGAITLAQPIVGMASTPTGNGYWLVAADGGIFSYGDAQYAGSVAGQLDVGEQVVAVIDPTST